MSRDIRPLSPELRHPLAHTPSRTAVAPPRILRRFYELIVVVLTLGRHDRTMTADAGSQYSAHLAKIPIFGSCTVDQLERLAELGNARTVGDAEDVVREGDKGGTFFVITSGRARVARGGHDVDTLGPGDYFGELSLFDPAPRDVTITALGGLSLVSLSRVAFAQALDEIPTFRDSLLSGMARRLHELDRGSEQRS